MSLAEKSLVRCCLRCTCGTKCWTPAPLNASNQEKAPYAPFLGSARITRAEDRFRYGKPDHHPVLPCRWTSTPHMGLANHTWRRSHSNGSPAKAPAHQQRRLVAWARRPYGYIFRCPPQARTPRKGRCAQAHRVPNHISKTVLSIVKIGPTEKDRTGQLLPVRFTYPVAPKSTAHEYLSFPLLLCRTHESS